MHQFKKVGIVGRKEIKDKIAGTIAHLIDYLLNKNLEIVLEEDVAESFNTHGLEVKSQYEFGVYCDLVIVVGGDGSLLTAARALAGHDIPVIGINRGGLGFLTDIAPHELELKLDAVFSGNYSTEQRFLLKTSIYQNGIKAGEGQALNDVVLSSAEPARMIEYELFIDDKFVYSQRSNGLIVSTPTGSTAYALSGGGPIMHPSLNAIGLVPMFPHTLTSRPLVIDGNSQIKIITGQLHNACPLVSCDGHMNFTCAPDNEVHISKMDKFLTLIHPTAHDFYDSCRSKLGWGSRIGT